MGGVGQLDVVRLGLLADGVTFVGAEVVEHEVQPDLGRVEAADVAAELEELHATFALLDVPVEAVRADVEGESRCLTPCGRV